MERNHNRTCVQVKLNFCPARPTQGAVESTRAHERYAIEIDAEITYADGVLPARTRNVSRGGLCIQAPRPLAAGQTVIVGLALVFDDLAMSEPLALNGRIVWCTRVTVESYQLGVTFVNLTAAQRDDLELVLRYLNR
jgi:Tfp pilus assembly protein PilZ